MKFSAAVVAVFAATVLVLSPVYGSFDCKIHGREDKSGAAKVEDCGGCLPDYCPETTFTSDIAKDPDYNCIVRGTNEECDTSATSEPWTKCKLGYENTDASPNVKCDEKCSPGYTNTAAPGHAVVCEDVKIAAQNDCTKRASEGMAWDSKSSTCVCKNGETKGVCNCDNPLETRDPKTFLCSRPVFDCSSVGRSDGQSTVFSVEDCKGCLANHCAQVADVEVNKDYSCVPVSDHRVCTKAAPWSQCEEHYVENSNTKLCEAKQGSKEAQTECNDATKVTQGYEVHEVNGTLQCGCKHGAFDAVTNFCPCPAEHTRINGTCVKDVVLPPSPKDCNVLNREKGQQNECLACKTGFHMLKGTNSTTEPDFKCHPQFAKDNCTASNRGWDNTTSLCLCKEKTKPKVEGEISANSECSDAIKLILSSTVLLASVASLFFLL